MMSRTHSGVMLRSGVLWLAVTSCGSHRGGGEHAHSVAAVPFGDAECGVCGMVVREQPAPRAQLVYHDGTRAFFCSVTDLALSMASPSPHGSVDAAYVEALDPAADPRDLSRALRPWVDARAAGYVLGVERGLVMGKPVLVYATNASAQAVARRYDGTVLYFNEACRRLTGAAER